MILTYLKQIAEAKFGKDVRSAICSAIRQCYDDGKAGATDLAAREQIEHLEMTVGDIPVIRCGTDAPDNSVGKDGDIYIQIMD